MREMEQKKNIELKRTAQDIENKYKQQLSQATKSVNLLQSKLHHIAKILDTKIDLPKFEAPKIDTYTHKLSLSDSSKPTHIHTPTRTQAPILEDDKRFGRCERAIMKFLAMRQGKFFTRPQIGTMTNYSHKSGGFNNSVGHLRKTGMIIQSGETFAINEDTITEVMEILGDEYNTPEQTSLEQWLGKLGLCARRIYAILLDSPTETFTKEYLGEKTGYSAGSGGFNNSIGQLCTLGLAERTPEGIRLNQELLNI